MNAFAPLQSRTWHAASHFTALVGLTSGGAESDKHQLKEAKDERDDANAHGKCALICARSVGDAVLCGVRKLEQRRNKHDGERLHRRVCHMQGVGVSCCVQGRKKIDNV